MVSSNFGFNDFYMRLMHILVEDPASEKYSKYCETDDYTGSKPCAYNVAKAFADSRNYLKKNVSRNEERWTWGDVHVNIYPNMPWSKTPLSPIFHREVSTPGNSHTPNVAKAPPVLSESRFTSPHAANFKMLV
jgi:acyl-homoserine lactone acylase PvdQ